jgi:hypothetical protein
MCRRNQKVQQNHDAVRHLSKSKLIESPDPSKRFGPYAFYTFEITELGTSGAGEIRVKLHLDFYESFSIFLLEAVEVNPQL